MAYLQMQEQERFIFLKSLAHKIIDIALPSTCLSCRERVREQACLCSQCWANLPQISHPICDKLGTPFAYEIEGRKYCDRAQTQGFYFHKARAAVLYNDVARKLVLGLKYQDRHEIALFMSRMMVHAGYDLLKQADAIIPVPLYWTRLWKRRFNQAGLLASIIAHQTSLPILEKRLQRHKSTKTQVGMSREQREKNVTHAFSVPNQHRSALYGKRLVLIDDVMTTGATANTCAHTLIKAGALQVDVLSFALVAHEDQLHEGKERWQKL